MNEQKTTRIDGRGTVIAVCTSERKGIRKRNVEQAELRPNWGIVGDAHAADWHRQVSLLAWESIEKMRALGLKVNVGSFAENVTTRGLSLVDLPVGTRLRLGEAQVEVTQIGKVCHERCAIYYQAGDCVMPREGIFVKVHRGGLVKVGDTVEVLAWPEAQQQTAELAHNPCPSD
ncbi:MAG TPA: MOSC domain-containing protein [Anaerolineae bacterium]|nr:MOSC domain-containing protein [Anaerolineae bacterium]